MKMLASARKQHQAAAFTSRVPGTMMLALTILASLPACHRDQSPSVVPDFTLPQVRGGVFDLHVARSQPVLLAFLQTVPDLADTPSRQQIGFLLSMNHQYSACGLKVVVIDASALATHQAPSHDALLNASYDWHLEVPLLEDNDNRIAARIGITQVPTLILLSPDGSIAQQWQGLTGPAILAQRIEKVCSRMQP
jgi:peroxiredoxin